MKSKIINWKEEFIKLFPESIERVLKDDEQWCEKCNGVGFKRDGNYISFCNHCNGTGITKLCVCGNSLEKYYTKCTVCREKDDKEYYKQIEKERFEKAEKIDYKYYKGYFYWNEKIIDNEDFEEELFSLIEQGEDVPNYIFATRKEIAFDGVDIQEEIMSKCEDNGYEDMESYLNLGSEKIIQAQSLIDEWVKDQGDHMYLHYEDFNRVVLLEDLIKEIKEEINSKSKV